MQLHVSRMYVCICYLKIIETSPNFHDFNLILPLFYSSITKIRNLHCIIELICKFLFVSAGEISRLKRDLTMMTEERDTLQHIIRDYSKYQEA